MYQDHGIYRHIPPVVCEIQNEEDRITRLPTLPSSDGGYWHFVETCITNDTIRLKYVGRIKALLPNPLKIALS